MCIVHVHHHIRICVYIHTNKVNSKESEIFMSPVHGFGKSRQKSQVAAPVNTITCTLEARVGTMFRVVYRLRVSPGRVGARGGGVGGG